MGGNGTRWIAWAVMASRAAGMAGFSNGWSIKIQELGDFSETNWNDRSVVEIAAQKKADGWFLHAITGEQWLLKLKFRMAKATFNREELISKLAMKPLNELHELPVYGTDRRVKVKTLRGPWQEVEMRVHSLEEIDHQDFWRFVEQAVAGFKKITQRVQQDPESVMPWTVLGRKWHLLRKGFPPGKRIAWEAEVLEELLEMLLSAAPQATGFVEPQPGCESSGCLGSGNLGHGCGPNGWRRWNCRLPAPRENSHWEELPN